MHEKKASFLLKPFRVMTVPKIHSDLNHDSAAYTLSLLETDFEMHSWGWKGSFWLHDMRCHEGDFEVQVPRLTPKISHLGYLGLHIMII